MSAPPPEFSAYIGPCRLKTLGSFGEAWAVGHLTRLGYRIVERNVRSRSGEIDIVAWDGSALVFVEVKTRRSRAYGSPEESITKARFRRLVGAIEQYLQRTGVNPDEYRVDVVALVVNAAGKVIEHRLLKAVEAPR